MNKLFKFSGIVRDVVCKVIKTKYGIRNLQSVKVEVMTKKGDIEMPQIYYLQYWGKRYEFKINDTGHFIGDISYRTFLSDKVFQKDGSRAEISLFNFDIQQFIKDNKSMIEWFSTKFSDWKSGLVAKVKETKNEEIEELELEDIYKDEDTWR